ncbi:hypothetical protein [Haloarchaeobius sp. DFWS5]|uniref:hypothetical protein n=1 Tax=Haloarchaeobius sp. DFWS5 TaxID=3446114 RepID=UPI003EB819B5
MPKTHTAESVPVCRSAEEHEAAFEEAERAGEALFVVDEEDAGYSLAYDLLPTGKRLTDDAKARLQDIAAEEVERIVGDSSNPVTEVRHTFGATMGSCYYLHDEATAREFAAMVSTVVLDEANWEDDPEGGDRLDLLGQ